MIMDFFGSEILSCTSWWMIVRDHPILRSHYQSRHLAGWFDSLSVTQDHTSRRNPYFRNQSMSSHSKTCLCASRLYDNDINFNKLQVTKNWYRFVVFLWLITLSVSRDELFKSTLVIGYAFPLMLPVTVLVKHGPRFDLFGWCSGRSEARGFALGTLGM
jgi:hypothetical protein